MTNIKNDGCSWIVRIVIDIVSSLSCLTRSKTSVHNWHLSGKVKVTTYREEMSSCEGKEIFHHDTFFDSTTPYKKTWQFYLDTAMEQRTLSKTLKYKQVSCSPLRATLVSTCKLLDVMLLASNSPSPSIICHVSKDHIVQVVSWSLPDSVITVSRSLSMSPKINQRKRDLTEVVQLGWWLQLHLWSR